MAATTFRIPPPTLSSVPVAVAAAPIPGGAAPAPPPAPLDVPTTGTTDAQGLPSWSVIGYGFLALAVAWLIATFAINDKHFPPAGSMTPVAGLTIFAVFFVAAQAIERLLEPFAARLDPKTGDALQAAAGKADDTAKKTVAAYVAGDAALVDSLKKETQAALDDAAKTKAIAATSKSNRKIIFWAIASAVGVLASASLKLYLLRTVGIAMPNRPLEVLATGLIIGSGTQPLHDLVGLISAKADTSKAAASTG